MTALQDKVALVVGAANAQAGLVAVMLASDDARSVSGVIAFWDGDLHDRA